MYVRSTCKYYVRAMRPNNNSKCSNKMALRRVHTSATPQWNQQCP